MEWTDQETTTLISLWPTHSAAQIATRLQCSREAVTGKAMRLRAEGVLPRSEPKHYENNPWPSRRRRSPRPRRFNPGADTAAATDDTLAMRPCSILELDDRHCHWPLGEVHQVAAMFCGAGTVPGRRYCAHHSRIASKGKALSALTAR